MEEQKKDGGKNKKMVNRKFMKEQKTRWRSGKQDEGTENKMAGGTENKIRKMLEQKTKWRKRKQDGKTENKIEN